MNIGELDKVWLLCHEKQGFFEGKECSLNSLEVALNAVHIFMAESDEVL